MSPGNEDSGPRSPQPAERLPWWGALEKGDVVVEHRIFTWRDERDGNEGYDSHMHRPARSTGCSAPPG